MPAVSRSLLPVVSEFVATHLGLHFPEDRWSDLERGFTTAARELGHGDAEQCARSLLSSTFTRSQIEVLASHLTIGETYFFREKESLDALVSQLVPAVVRSDRIRIWSAGCCSGEEPYSIAMLLAQSVSVADRANIAILGTDINPRFLRKAAAGLYGEWSFRAIPPGYRERYFRKRGDRRWEIDPGIRNMVTFSYLNLAADVYPSLLNDTNAMDVIFCRNVLMYFSADRMKEVVARFHRALVPGGWLIVSATETSKPSFSQFEPVQFSGGTLYRKAIAEEPQPIEIPEPVQIDPARIRPVRIEAAPVDAPPPVNAEDLVVMARRFADEGKLAEAAACCERALDIDKVNPLHHYLLAAVQREMGRSEDAVQSLRRAIYLDHDFVLAHFGLANIELSRGRQREAERHFSNALAALRSHPPDEVFPESDGLTAGRLAEIITSILEAAV